MIIMLSVMLLLSPKHNEQTATAGAKMARSAVVVSNVLRTNVLAWNPYRVDLTNSVLFDVWGSPNAESVKSSPIKVGLTGNTVQASVVTTNQQRFFFTLSVRWKP